MIDSLLLLLLVFIGFLAIYKYYSRTYWFDGLLNLHIVDSITTEICTLPPFNYIRNYWEDLKLKRIISKSRRPPVIKKRTILDDAEAIVAEKEVRNEPIFISKDCTVAIKDITLLQDSEWLNDQIVNGYMSLINKRSEEEGPLKVHCFNTFFYSMFKNNGYERVRRWTKNVDIFSFDVIIVPVHIVDHWCLGVIDFRSGTVSIYDSAGILRPDVLEDLALYLELEHMDKKNTNYDVSKLELKSLGARVPQQRNAVDCGVFTCQFAEYVARDEPFDFSQINMIYFREKMFCELVLQKFLPNYLKDY